LRIYEVSLANLRVWSCEPTSLVLRTYEFHYRDRGGAEADLVLELPGGNVIAVEVKASTSFQAAHFKNLLTLRDRLGHRFLMGVVLNTGSHGYRYADRLIGLPVSALWQL